MADMQCGAAAGGFRAIFLFAMGAVALFPAAGRAQYVLEDESNPRRYEPGTVAVPIGYRSGSISAAIGAAASESGFFQPQESAFVFLIGSTNGSYGAVTGMSDLQIRPVDRLFLDWQLYYFRTEHDENNINGDRRFPNQVAGSNDSSQHNFVSKASNDLIGDFTFKFLLPIGDGRDRIIDHYTLHEGLLKAGPSGGDAFNPLTSGRSYLQLHPSFEYMDIRSPRAVQHQWDTNNLILSCVYDNRDFVVSPERGNLTSLSVQRDFGLFGSSGPWTNLSAEMSQYVSLGQSGWFRQQVIALDGWTSYCPTWSQSGAGRELRVSGGPPFYAGAQLGGETHFRGYPEERFHDRAGIYGCAELRLIPWWNPFNKIPLLKEADLAWWQLVSFIEIGRVADEFTADKLFSKPKGDVGVGVRFLTQDTVLRIDVAGSNEGIQVWANLAEAF